MAEPQTSGVAERFDRTLKEQTGHPWPGVQISRPQAAQVKSHVFLLGRMQKGFGLLKQNQREVWVKFFLLARFGVCKRRGEFDQLVQRRVLSGPFHVVVTRPQRRQHIAFVRVVGTDDHGVVVHLDIGIND